MPELIQFDPTGDYLDPRSQGFRLENGVYVPIPLRGDRLYSEQLGLEAVWLGEEMRLYDPVRKEWLLSPLEQAQRAEAAEAEVVRLRAELEALRKQR